MNLSFSRRAAPALRLPTSVRMLLGTMAIAVVAGLARPAFAQPTGPHGGMQGMHRMHGMGGPGMEMGMGGRMLDLVNATPDQRTQIKAIMDAARSDLKAQHASGRALHQQMQTLLAQPTIDAVAAESVRQQMLALHGTASKRMLQAALDAANLLTPTQRKTLADAMTTRQAMMQRHAAERAAMDKSSK